MDAGTLARLRPADDSHAALRVALSAAAAQRAVTVNEALAARRRHAAALAGGTMQEVRKAEQEARDCDLTLQQLDVFEAGLKANEPAARGADLIKSLRAQQARAEELVAQFNAAWPSYREHAEAIAAILRLEADAQAVCSGMYQALRTLGGIATMQSDTHEFAPGAVSSIKVPQLPGFAYGASRSLHSTFCRLSPAADGEEPLWNPRT